MNGMLYCDVLPQSIEDHRYGLAIERVGEDNSFNLEVAALYAAEEITDLLIANGVKHADTFISYQITKSGEERWNVHTFIPSDDSVILRLEKDLTVSKSEFVEKLVNEDDLTIYKGPGFYSCGIEGRVLNGIDDSENYSSTDVRDQDRSFYVGENFPDSEILHLDASLTSDERFDREDLMQRLQDGIMVMSELPDNVLEEVDNHLGYHNQPFVQPTGGFDHPEDI